MMVHQIPLNTFEQTQIMEKQGFVSTHWHYPTGSQGGRD
jgi:hypothetical protein